MASLTPGVLLKLLQSMNTDVKVVGEHRSAVLQLIGIVPALSSGSGSDDLWPSNGFYLQLSDSVNSTYVSLSDSDSDAILSSRPQLGQLVLVDRLLPSLPVPRAAGLRPVPRPPIPFSGTPQPLVARFSPSQSGFLIQPAKNTSFDQIAHAHIAKNESLDESGDTRIVFSSKENIKNPAETKRRFLSPAGGKSSSRKSAGPAERRDPSPASGKGNSRPSSPVPSKCAVPGLVAAREENRRSSREPAIVVPSRYRQPSPVGARKGSASPVMRRASASPSRRISGGLRLTPTNGESGKKRMGVMVGGIARVSDALGGSARSVRKSWEDPASESPDQKEKGSSRSRVDQKAILRTQAAISRRLSNASSEEIVNQTSNEKQSPLDTVPESSIVSEKSNHAAPRIVVHNRKWTDGSIPLDSVSDNLSRLGKEALQRRNIASTAAAEALEEALANESIIRSLCMFSDLCSSSKSVNPLPSIERFLSIYSDVGKWNSANDSISTDRSKSVHLWVEAALATDLEILSLLNDTAESLLKEKNLVAIPSDPLRSTLTKRNSVGTPARMIHSKSSMSFSKGHGSSGEAVELAKVLRHEMQNWFLKFVEESLDVGFRLFGELSDNVKVAAVLSHLKRVNDWLDGVGRNLGEEALAEKIERLKRKIYGFVISHVGSAFDNHL